jgi:hypothetical protein
MGRGFEDLKRFVRVSLTPETLPEPSPESDPSSRRPSLLRRLLASEPLPEAPTGVTRTRTSMFTLLFGRDHLPVEPVLPRTRHHWMAMLFAPERLDPPGDAGPEVR